MINNDSFKCVKCGRNFFDYLVTPYSVTVNGSIEFICSECLSKFQLENNYHIKIIMDYYEYYEKGVRKKGECVVFDGSLVNIKSLSNKLYVTIYEYILFRSSLSKDILIESLDIYKKYKDKMCVTKYGTYPMFFFKLEYKKNIIGYNIQRCSCCDNHLDYLNYFFLKDNQLSLVCKECHDRVYGDEIK